MVLDVPGGVAELFTDGRALQGSAQCSPPRSRAGERLTFWGPLSDTSQLNPGWACIHPSPGPDPGQFLPLSGRDPLDYQVRGQPPGPRKRRPPFSPVSLHPLHPLCRRSGVGGPRRGERTFQAHPHRQALLEAAEGTALALRLVDLAALALGARVVLVVLHRALEEALGRGESAWGRATLLCLLAGLCPAFPCARLPAPCYPCRPAARSPCSSRM